MVTGMLNVPSLSLTVSLPAAELHLRRLVDGQRVDRGSAQDGAARGRAQGQCQRLVGAGVGEERAGDVPVVCPIPNVSGLAVTPL